VQLLCYYLTNFRYTGSVAESRVMSFLGIKQSRNNYTSWKAGTKRVQQVVGFKDSLRNKFFEIRLHFFSFFHLLLLF
jgi:hypothetical protein